MFEDTLLPWLVIQNLFEQPAGRLNWINVVNTTSVLILILLFASTSFPFSYQNSSFESSTPIDDYCAWVGEGTWIPSVTYSPIAVLWGKYQHVGLWSDLSWDLEFSLPDGSQTQGDLVREVRYIHYYSRLLRLGKTGLEANATMWFTDESSFTLNVALSGATTSSVGVTLKWQMSNGGSGKGEHLYSGAAYDRASDSIRMRDGMNSTRFGESNSTSNILLSFKGNKRSINHFLGYKEPATSFQSIDGPVVVPCTGLNLTWGALRWTVKANESLVIGIGTSSKPVHDDALDESLLGVERALKSSVDDAKSLWNQKLAKLPEVSEQDRYYYLAAAQVLASVTYVSSLGYVCVANGPFNRGGSQGWDPLPAYMALALINKQLLYQTHPSPPRQCPIDGFVLDFLYSQTQNKTLLKEWLEEKLLRNLNGWTGKELSGSGLYGYMSDDDLEGSFYEENRRNELRDNYPIEAVDLNSYLISSARSAANAYNELGNTTESSYWSSWAENKTRLMNQRLWNGILYVDRTTGGTEFPYSKDKLRAILSLQAFYAGVPDKEQAAKIVDWVGSKSLSSEEPTGNIPIASGETCHFANMFTIFGLVKYGFYEYALRCVEQDILLRQRSWWIVNAVEAAIWYPAPYIVDLYVRDMLLKEPIVQTTIWIRGNQQIILLVGLCGGVLVLVFARSLRQRFRSRSTVEGPRTRSGSMANNCVDWTIRRSPL